MKHLFILILLGFICNHVFAQVPSYVDTTGLLAWYPLDSNVNNVYGAPMNNGVPYGGVSYDTDRFGIANHCYHGDSMSAVNIPVNNFPIGNASRSVSIFFKCAYPFPGGNRVLFAWGDNSGFGRRFGIVVKDTAVAFEHWNGGVNKYFIPDSLWHNFVVTYPVSGMGSSSAKIYFDGVLGSTSIQNPISSLNTDTGSIHCIGTLFYDPYLYSWAGDIDDIGVWDRELTACEVEHLYNSGPVYPPVTVSGLTLTTSSNDITYQWLLGSTSIAGATDSSYHATSGGSYRVVVTDSSGCSDTSHVVAISSTAAANVYLNGGDVIVYPNPSKSVFSIQSSFSVNVTLTNMIGEILTQKDDAKEIDLYNLPDGIYFLSVFDKMGVKIKTERISLLR